MAWTARADRFTPLNQNDDIGPGSYGGHEEYQPDPHYAPFGSSKPRSTAVSSGQEFRSQDPQWSSSPSPGDYDPKLPKAYDSGLPKKHVPFTSGAPRVCEQAAKDQAPGPGAYHVVGTKLKAQSCRTMGAPPADIAPMIKSSSAPSIPCNHQSYGYEETGDGRLVRQGPRDKNQLHSGKNGDTVGPGHYSYGLGQQPIFGRILPMHGPKPDKVDTNPGPGHYDSKWSKNHAITSSFVSTCNQRPKGKEKFAHPGPGAYDPQASSRPDLREVCADMQYFGSTTERFKDPSSRQAPGPGHYEERRRENAKSSWIKSGRFQDGSHAAKQPGPGQYDPGAHEGKTSGPLGTVSILGSTGCLAFGSMESKLSKGKRSDAPGPGAYHTPSDEPSTSSGAGRAGRRMTKAMRSQSESAVFRSGVPHCAMTLLSVKEGQQRPPPGAYTPTLARDTGTVMRQPPKAEGFLSAEARGDPMARSSPAPGPGRYDAPMEITGGKKIGSFNRTIVEGAPTSGRPRGLGFETQARRFKLRSTKETPGPGAYNTEPDWITKTHNVHFGDVG